MSATAPAPVPMAVMIEVVKIYFDTGKDALPADAAVKLNGMADKAKAKAGSKLVISGYHDATGDLAQNEELAKKRAMAVRDALTGAGIPEAQIEMKKPEQTQGGGGADNPEARRVEVGLTS